MLSQPARSARFSRAAAVAGLVLASIIGHGAFAQATGTAGSATSSALPMAPAAAAVSTQDIRDIRGPKSIPSRWFIPLIMMTALLAGASGCATWTWYRRRRTVLRTPFDVAIARLECARTLMRPELGRDFSIEVSSIAREYIESRFRIMAAHLTTHEFLHESLDSRDPVLAAHRALLAGFLECCDLAKFGGWNLSLPTMETMLQSARRFIVESAAEPPPFHTPEDALPPATRATATRSPALRETYDSLPST
jgi:hypothetical protein